MNVHRWSTGWRVGGVLAGIAAVVALANTPQSWLGLGIALIGPAFGLCLLAGVIVGELRPPPTGPVRTATLRVRGPGRYLPRTMTAVVAACAVTLAAFLAVTTAVASADDMGRVGRSLSVACPPDRGAAAGPWPGLFYSAPIGLAVLVGLAAAVVATRAVVRRRPQTVDPETDDAARRRSARTIVAASGVLTAAPLAGAALVSGWALHRVDCGGSWLGPLGWASLALAAAAALTAAACMADVLLPPRSTP